MSDLYRIPNDDGKTYRLQKFVEYQHEVPSIHYRFLGEYVRRERLSLDETADICYLMSCTYNEITCLPLFLWLKSISADKVWELYKGNLFFGSARKYAKNNDLFPDLVAEWNAETGGRPYEWVKARESADAYETYRRIQGDLTKLRNVGRFASDLFMEMLVYLREDLSLNIKEPLAIDWKNCANLTSGIYNIFYEDERANEFDKTHRVTEQEKQYLSAKLKIIQNAIRETYPDQDSEVSMFIGKICSFRNLFKNARYGGFHHDRELEWIREYERYFPELSDLWEKCYEIRRDIFPHRFLGELNGWNGIRKERKKLWLTTGKTGVET